MIYHLRSGVVPLFKCECTFKSIEKFCEVAPIEKSFCGSCHFIAVSQGVLELNSYLSTEYRK